MALTDSAAVRIVLSALTLADHPGDTAARFHLVHSPLGKHLGLADHRDDGSSWQVAANLRQMLLADGNYPAIATHDEPMIEATVDFHQKEGISKDSFEFQMLHGVRRDLQSQLVADGFNVRVYVPFGTHWYPYLMRRLAERPANMLFMAGSVVKESPLGFLWPGGHNNSGSNT